MPQPRVTVAVDAIGGDRGPAPVLEGVAAALSADPDLVVLLVGPASVVSPFAGTRDRVEVLLAEDVIAMDEHAAAAVRSKRDSSIVKGCDAVKEGRAGGFFSAGNTGAVMAAATLRTGRLPGVVRPALATVLPFGARPTVLLDVGAQADVKAESLLQFGHMGVAYARCVLGTPEPSVALLNIGEEETKGSQLAQEAHALMRASLPSFEGNAEGRDIPMGTFDVVVTDGFTGNVVLKLLEGYSSWMFSQLKEAMTETLPAKIAAGVLRPSLSRMRERLDPETYGGAPLLGIAGVVLIGHGSSGVRAVASGIAATARGIRTGLVENVAAGVAGEDSALEA